MGWKAKGMKASEWVEYCEKQLAAAERQLADFREGIATRQLRIHSHDLSGSRDVTDEMVRSMEQAVDEWRRVLELK